MFVKTKEGPPSGYAYGNVLGKRKYHLIKIAPWNSESLCGKYLHDQRIVECEGIEREVCSNCLELAKS